MKIARKKNKMKTVKANTKTTLLLNNAWQPITIVTARAAFGHLLKKRITALDKYSNVFHSLDTWNELADYYEDQPALPSAKQEWPIPTIVIVTSKFFKKPRKKKLNLHELAKVCGNKCQYCFEVFPIKSLTIDHVYPKSRGGEDEHANRVLACRSCNMSKASHTPWFDANGKVPEAPQIPEFMFSLPEIREEWKVFLKSVEKV
ncbi:HNH endonuclease [bacterium]|nr:HNH endonuclease [bacterium]